MKSVRFILIISLMVFTLLLLPTYSLEVFGKRVIGPQSTPKAGDVKVKTSKDLESLRSSFKKGVAALNNGNGLIAGLLLGGLEEEYPVLGDYVLYHRTRAAIEIGHFPLALSLAGRFLNDYPESVLTHRVQMEMVKAFYLLEQFSSARTVAGNLLNREIDPEMKRQLSLMLGEAYEGEEDWKGAVRVYQRLVFEEPAAPEGEEAERRIIRIAEESGIQPVTPADSLFLTRVKALNKSLMFDRVIESCDSFQEVYPVGKSLDNALLLKARALLKNNRVEEGQKLYERLSRSGGTGAIQAAAAYSLASHYWNAHGNSKAKKGFKRLIKRFPRGEWGIKARYALGRIYEAEKSISKAREYYLSVGKINPNDPLAAKGAWRAGWVEYKAGKFEKAAKSFDFCMKRYSQSDFFIGALYWKGRCKERLKHAEEAQKIFRRLAQNYSWTFYGIMARKRMESSWNLIPDSDETGEGTAWEPEPIHAEPGTPLAYHLERSEELNRIGFFKESKEEIDALQAL
jgi:tetratricopeptide (TPR) repeat protein